MFLDNSDKSCDEFGHLMNWSKNNAVLANLVIKFHMWKYFMHLTFIM